MRFPRRRPADADLVDDPAAGLPPAGADHSLFGTPVRQWPTPVPSGDQRPPRTATERARAAVGDRAVMFRRWLAVRWLGWFVLVLDVLGVVLLDVAAFKVWEPLGYAVAGVACLVMSWVLDPSGRQGGRQ